MNLSAVPELCTIYARSEHTGDGTRSVAPNQPAEEGRRARTGSASVAFSHTGEELGQSADQKARTTGCSEVKVPDEQQGL